MLRTLSKAAFAMAFAGAFVPTQAACNRPSFGTDAVDPVKVLVKWGLGRSTDVFVGTVTAMEYVPVNNGVSGSGEMLVIRTAAGPWWKGGGGREVTLHTLNFKYADGGSCTESHEYIYALGKTYLV